MFYGIARFVPENVTEDHLCVLVTNCIKASHIGSTRSFKLQFSCRGDLTVAISAPVVVKYERVHVEEFVPLPHCCYNCQRMVIYLPPVRLLPVVNAVDKKDTPANVILLA